ncbi:VOC family protein [Roseibium aggregatum]|uniref:VOC family protein n=1 Tax=Roseibium aggregatum TaxID=187304 RepID=A0A926S587_9HYPH|nr:VOC family protein [Roseibium aggregatum]MBD1545182.1 VOC family protein [Roseibium aggregatum]
MEQRISLVTLAVDDVGAVAAFFENGLGWTRSGGEDDVAFYQTGGSILALYARKSLEEEIGRALPADTLGGMTIAWNGRSEAEVDRAFQQAVDAGAEPVKRPEKAFWGGYSSYVAIPGGHLLEIAYNPFWPIDGDGNIAIPIK